MNRSVGSIYYIAYASGHMELIDERALWVLVAFTAFASAVIHGTTSILVDRFGSKMGQGPLRLQAGK